MKNKTKIIISAFAIAAVAGLCVGSYFIGKSSVKPITSTIKPIGKPISTQLIETPTNMNDCLECFNNKIEITPRFITNTEIEVTASDKCKQTKQKYKINTALKQHLIMFNVGANFIYKNEMTFNLGYYHRLLNTPIFFGGGVMVNEELPTFSFSNFGVFMGIGVQF